MVCLAKLKEQNLAFFLMEQFWFILNVYDPGFTI